MWYYTHGLPQAFSTIGPWWDHGLLLWGLLRWHEGHWGKPPAAPRGHRHWEALVTSHLRTCLLELLNTPEFTGRKPKHGDNKDQVLKAAQRFPSTEGQRTYPVTYPATKDIFPRDIILAGRALWKYWVWFPKAEAGFCLKLSLNFLLICI